MLFDCSMGEIFLFLQNLLLLGIEIMDDVVFDPTSYNIGINQSI